MAFENIPRGPVRNPRSGSFDFEDGYDRKIQEFRAASREEARRTYRLNSEAAKVIPYINAIQGEGFWPGRRPWRSPFVDNRIAKTRQDHLAQLTDTQPIIDVTTGQDAYQQTASVISAMIRARWPKMNADLSLASVADIADVYGTGFWRIGAANPGSMSLDPCGPDQVMPIQPQLGNLQASSAVYYRTWKSAWWLKQKFPFTSSGIENEASTQPVDSANQSGITFNRPNHIDEVTWNGLSQGFKRLVGIRGVPVVATTMGSQFYKTLEVEEIFVDDPTCNDSLNSVIVSDPFLPFDAHNWWYEVKRTQRLFPRKRHLIFAGSKLLSDGPSPYFHGLYPFAMLQFNPVFWSFWGLGKYRDLLPVNIGINELVAGTLDLCKRALNPTAVTKEGAVGMAAWRDFYPDLPGMKLRIGANQNVQDALKYMDNPQLPSYVPQMLQFLTGEYDRLAGSINMAGLTDKNQVPSGDSIDTYLATQNQGLKMEERLLGVFLRDAGKQVVSNEIQFSSLDYRMQMLGEAGMTREDFNKFPTNMLPEDRAAHPDFHKNFSMTIQPSSLKSGAKQQASQMSVSLAAKNLLPITDMYDAIGQSDPQGTFDRLVKELHAVALAEGVPKPVQGKSETL